MAVQNLFTGKFTAHYCVLHSSVLYFSHGGEEVNTQLRKGVIELCILALIAQKDMYGYEMIEALREKSQNVFELKAGTLYPLLHGLEEKNFVTSYEQKVMGKERKYYRLTAAGHGRLEEKKEEWKAYQKAVTDVLAMEGLG